MALDTPRGLFLYELGGMRDAENAGGSLLGLLIGSRVRNSDLEQLLHEQAGESQRQLKNIDSCFQVLGGSSIQTRSTTVEGMRSGFQEFIATRPSPEVQDLFALDAAARFAHLAIAAYKILVDWAVLLDESQCAQMLQANLGQKQEGAGKLERIGHRMSEQLLTTAGRS
jgi:ferritin-like metal-binding protein YciE